LKIGRNHTYRRKSFHAQKTAQQLIAKKNQSKKRRLRCGIRRTFLGKAKKGRVGLEKKNERFPQKKKSAGQKKN